MFSPVSGLVSSVSVAYAAPAVVPVVGEALYGLLVALGLVVGNEAGEYVWKGNDNPYVDSIFESQVAGITSGIPISTEMLGQVEEKVIPADTYTTDGTSYYVGNKELLAADLYVKAKSLIDISYDMPVNINGLLPGTIYQYAWDHPEWKRCRFLYPYGSVGTDDYFFEYYITDTSEYVNSVAFNIASGSDSQKTSVNRYNFASSGSNLGDQGVYNSAVAVLDYIHAPIGINSSSSNSIIYASDTLEPYSFDYNSYFCVYTNPQLLRVSGNETFVADKVIQMALLQTKGVPVTQLTGDKEKLGSSVVKVTSGKDDDDDPNTPPTPVPPGNWEIWKAVEDLVHFIDTGEVNNGGTTFDEFVNNNYNYVNVEINVPDTQNINVTGDVTIHEDVSLPVGEGDGFFNPDAADVVAALGKDNPVLELISGVFAAIDPRLVAVFSVTVSLALALGLWKLIRG